MIKKTSACSAALALLLTAAACGNKAEEGEVASNTDEPLQVYTTLFAWESLASEIGGDYVDVANIIPPGTDAHSYEPTPQTMIDVAEGDTFIYNGAGMDGFAESIIDSAGEDLEAIEVTEGMTLQGSSFASGSGNEPIEETEKPVEAGENYDHNAPETIEIEGLADHYHTGDSIILTAESAQQVEGETWHWLIQDYEGEEWSVASNQEANEFTGEAVLNGQTIKAVQFNEADKAIAQSAPVQIHIDDHGGEDPHVWLDPVLALNGAEKIKNDFIDMIPEHEEDLEANFQEVEEELKALDDRFTELSEEADKHQFLVSHSGYGYWNQRYGIEQIGITGINPNEEPSQRQLQNIIGMAEENELNHVMLEQNISTKVAEVVQDETGAEALTIHNLESIMEDEQGEDYFSVMNENVDHLEEALN